LSRLAGATGMRRGELLGLLLSGVDALPPTVSKYLTDRKDKLVIAYVYGGTSRISDQNQAAISKAIS